MIIRKQAQVIEAEEAWEVEISKARPPLSKKVVRLTYPEAVKNALTAYDEVMGN